MVRISKIKLQDDILMRIYQLFFELVLRSQSKDSFLDLLDDILTPTEKIMLAKRIGIIYLVIKGVDQRTIAHVLKVSSSTVASHALLIHKQDSRVVVIIRKMLTKEKVLGFIEDVFADLFIQPGLKIGHYKLQWEHKKRIEERKVLG